MVDPMDSIRAELAAIDAAGLRRRMRPIDGPQAAEIVVDGKHAINFSSNNYLGLANDIEIVKASSASAATSGFGAGSSRMIAGSLAPHRALESALAEWLETERALLFNSGFLANLGVLGALTGPDDVVLSDQLNHASIIDGCRLSRARIEVYPHCDIAALETALSRSRARRTLVVTESMFSMDGDVAPLADIVRVARAQGALVVVDEAHAIGALGSSGRGLAFGLDTDLVMGTLGKSLGGFGAFIAANTSIVELVSQRARSFVFSTALPSSVPAAALAALSVLRAPRGEDRRTALRARSLQLFTGLESLGLHPKSPFHIQPVFVRGGDPMLAMHVSNALLDRGVFVQGIRPPTVPRGTSRLRISIMATHTQWHVEHLLQALAEHRNGLATTDELGFSDGARG